MKPWITGPKELLEHAIEHLRGDTPFDSRIAFISIDNAVELCIKTYLGLPRRIREAVGPPRRRLQEAAFSFPDLLDLLEEFASEKVAEIDLGEVEWFHRLRNTLYHEGNGITVEPEKVDGYLQVARILFENLMGEAIEEKTLTVPVTDTGTFIQKWSQLESNLRILVERNIGTTGQQYAPVQQKIDWLREKGMIDTEVAEMLHHIRRNRNEIVHGASKLNPRDLKRLINQIRAFDALVEGKIEP